MDEINWHGRAKEANLSVRNVINGQYQDCRGKGKVVKDSPQDDSLLYTFSAGDGSEVEESVANARAAFEDGRWCGLSVYQRKAVLQKLADLIETHNEELALYECLDVGKPITHALQSDVPRSAATLRVCAEGADKLLSPSGAAEPTSAISCVSLWVCRGYYWLELPPKPCCKQGRISPGHGE